MLQLEANLQVHRDSVERIGKEIAALRGLPSIRENGHELLLYSNIRQYSSYFLKETKQDWVVERTAEVEETDRSHVISWAKIRHLLCG
ncbi:unnamed protein product [Bursaphelenchus xylophilus]|nr:unnamed protein product [Bursaphelenchus xylophilus]CAG9116246.1 unnamed protein product [Bursaphelenchus xylophilus]